jgi:hypothetical protein
MTVKHKPDVIGLNQLKDKFRLAKLKCGDLRGLKNAFGLSERLGVPALQTYYFKAGGNGEIRMELVADCHRLDKKGTIYAYTMKELIEDIKNEPGQWEINLVCNEWNKHRTDAERKDILTFIYSNNH